MRGERGEVIGVVIQVVACLDLTGASVAAAVMRDDAIALFQEEHHLVVPVVGGERPAVRENDGLAGAPVLVENCDSIFRGDRWHCDSPFASSSVLSMIRRSWWAGRVSAECSQY